MANGGSSFMDRRVKERLVGATILSVLIVLIVPEMLSGPKMNASRSSPGGSTDAVRNVTVDLATSKTVADAAPGIAASAATPEEGPAAASAAVPPATTNTPTVTTLQAQRPAASVENTEMARRSPVKGIVAPPPAPADEARRGFTVQLGSFANRQNAEKLEHRLKAEGFAAHVSSSGSGNGLRYRVRIGSFGDRAAAEKTLLRLRKEGRAASIIAP